MAFLNGFQYFLHSIFILIFCSTFVCCNVRNSGDHNYKEALTKSILFFEGQRSGKLPLTQRMIWRGDSALSDGNAARVDLTGGYYDAGDNVKFNLPMAFTTTMLSWSVVEFGDQMGSDDLKSAREAIRWGTDYLLKCARATPGKLYAGVGNPNADHNCWERPEDMDTDRSPYWVSASNPGSDVAAETAAALAAASIVFQEVDPGYSKLLLNTAKTVMQFAIDHRGAYSDSLSQYVCPYYCSYSGYKDELFWGAAWLFTATNYSGYYYNFIKSLGANDDVDIFSWDNKFAGARVLLSRLYLVGKDSNFQQFSQQAENFMCKVLPGSNTQYTKGGLMYKLDGSNLQYVTAITFLLTTYAKYMATSKHSFSCGGPPITSTILRNLAKKQVDYILGDNPMTMSYMVGYGTKYPQRVHHRGSSVPSVNDHPLKISCGDGFSYLHTSNPNPNILTGAIVGGPDRSDGFADNRDSYGQSEPTTYINAAIVGPLAYLAAKQK